MGRGHPSRLPCCGARNDEERQDEWVGAIPRGCPVAPLHGSDCPCPGQNHAGSAVVLQRWRIALPFPNIAGTVAGQPQGIAPTHPVLPSHAPPRLIPCCHPPYTWEHLSQWAWTRMGSGFTACGIVRNKWNICHNCHNASPCRGATGMEEDRRWIATHTISLFTIPILIYIYNIGIEGDGWRWWR